MTAAEWECFLCGRSEQDIKISHLPKRQRAHLVANRFTGAQVRYGGVKKPYTQKEWSILVTRLGRALGIPAGASLAQAKELISEASFPLCGECHEEVLSEPIYLPEVFDTLRRYFPRKSRVEKQILLARLIKLGAEQLVEKGGPS